ncbi:MAG TPA: hypothetical protein PLF26_02520 [Blastocatellia bacterium]|nr:hypothetical protein [Blastocatellia bacterium]
MDDSNQRRHIEDRYTRIIIGRMLAVLSGMVMMFTVFLAPVGIVVIGTAIVVAGYASYRRGDFKPRHP